MHKIFFSRLLIVCCLTNFIVPNFAMAQNPTASGAHTQSTAKTKEAPAEHQTENTGFACTDIKNIGKINIAAFGIEISNLRARGIPGIANSFNLFEVRYKISNNRDKKIWASGEFIFGFDGNLAGAVSTNPGLAGILPHETEIIKSQVISKDIFLKTKSFCYRFSIEQQK